MVRVDNDRDSIYRNKDVCERSEQQYGDVSTGKRIPRTRSVYLDPLGSILFVSDLQYLATERMCIARATDPTVALSAPLYPFPATKAPPPFDTWMITGELAFMAASRTAFAVEELYKKEDAREKFKNRQCPGIPVTFRYNLKKNSEANKESNLHYLLTWYS